MITVSFSPVSIPSAGSEKTAVSFLLPAAADMLQQKNSQNLHKQQSAEKIYTVVIQHAVFQCLSAQKITNSQQQIDTANNRKNDHQPCSLLIQRKIALMPDAGGIIIAFVLLNVKFILLYVFI